MKSLYQRAALLTGVSVSVLGFVSPAFAATNPGIEHAVTDADVDDLLTICDIGDTCEFGVSESGAGLVTATVTDAAHGQIRQIGTATATDGDVLLQMINSGDASLSAVASASDAGGMATAIAVIAPAIVQSGHGAGDVALDLSNDGSIEIHAVADASGSTYAFAFATAYGGIQQIASSTGTGDASISMTNDGIIIAGATGHAESTGAAHVTAAAVYGVGAQAVAADGDVSIDLTNNGEISVIANAIATGGHTADAIAIAAGGIVAFATGFGEGDASAVVANDGSLLVEANAHAVGTTNALAVAIGVTGAYEVVHAATGNAFASIENRGSIGIYANATATGLVAQATAVGGGGLFGGAIFQSAAAMNGDAVGILDNSGDIVIAANADANGSVIAYANAFGGPGVEQLIFATGGDATAHLTNSGSILLSAVADASATNSAFASALYFNVFNNAAFANSGDAQAVMTNAGTLAVDVAAHAVADNVVGAHANASHMVGQFAFGFAGDADLTLDNSGSIAILAEASAVGATAHASATVAQGLYQSAFAIFGGSADAEMTNDGSIAIGADAFASGEFATASAFNRTVIFQNAFASSSGDASVSLDNQGTIAISAAATAEGNDGPAYALGVVAGGIIQSANAFDGIASASLINDGAIEISAVAQAHGGGATLTFPWGSMTFTTAIGATVTAAVTAALVQNVGGMDGAEALMTNSGDIDISVVALASGAGFETELSGGTQLLAGPRAFGLLSGGLIQVGSSFGGDVDLAIDNDGEINIVDFVQATSTGEGPAFARAWLFSALAQNAQAGTGDAVAEITNSGDLNVLAAALANGSTAPAQASVQLVGGIGQSVNAAGDAIAEVTNSGSLVIAASAEAHATQSEGHAGASILRGIQQVANGYSTVIGTGTAAETVFGDAHVALDNSGSLLLAANGVATGDSAFGNAQIATGIAQFAFAAGSGDATLTNSGDLTLFAAASASADDGRANAGAGIQIGIGQRVFAADSAAASIDNEGDLILGAAATAAALTADGDYAGSATAIARLGGVTFIGVHGVINQEARANEAIASLTNSGSLDASVIAAASGTAARAGANVIIGMKQQAMGFDGAAAATAVNDGDMHFGALALAHASGQGATAVGTVGNGFDQQAHASNGDALASFTNNGTIEIEAAASATGTGDALAYAIANGGSQQARANGVVDTASGTAPAVGTALFDNGGTFSVAAIALATGGDHVVGSGTFANLPVATALASAVGLGQAATNAIFINDGTFSVAASASANGSTQAMAGAKAVGLFETPGSFFGGSANLALANSGDFAVEAAAVASASSASAHALAVGVQAMGSAIQIDADNSGSISVAASAAAAGAVNANAVGLMLHATAFGTTSATPPTTTALIEGTITNSGEIEVVAFASGATTAKGTAPASAATATAIQMVSGVNTANVVNSGSIVVEAVTANGGKAVAKGVAVTGNGTGIAPSTSDVFTFTNDGGDIVVRQSSDGGDSWQRGMAIDLGSAPNASVVNLLGDGSIYGNIAVQDGDVINVEGGTTYFDGIINPDLLPKGGVTEADVDSGLAGVGTLNIREGGNLVLADPRVSGDPAIYDGPAYAIVDTLDIDADGTLTYQLQPLTGGVQEPGSYPQIFADQASLDGTLVAELATPGGLFADSYDWDNVIDANGLSGTFDQCKLGGAYAGSLFLDFSCSYDGNANVDLSLDRIAFDAVAGLSGNRAAVAGALEDVYDPGLTGGFGALFADLFLITDEVDYDNALNQLAGSAYANYLQSFASLGVHGNDLIDRASDCEDPAPGASSLTCRTGPIHVWGQLDYQWRKTDGDSEGGATSSRRMTGLMGIDAQVGEAAVVGVSAGAVSNYLRDRQFGDTVNGDGGQFGLYAAFDPGAFFVKGVATYAWYDGTSSRHIDFRPLGGSVHGEPGGKPDVKMWTAGIHAGARLPLGATAAATPYLNLDYVHARLNAFTEVGLAGANLQVEGGTNERAIATGGVKLGARLGSVRPELNLGYRHAFGDSRSSFTAGFAADPSSSFDIVSASQSRDTLLAGASLGGKVGPVDLRIGYEGEFNGDATSHGGTFKIVVPLGGAKR